ncbi:MAG: 2-hydroxy-6-oxo-6-phenylhexa-2,4-dienoate hydrolase, partial [uncultured Acetobacteraceae bacterium]
GGGLGGGAAGGRYDPLAGAVRNGRRAGPPSPPRRGALRGGAGRAAPRVRVRGRGRHARRGRQRSRHHLRRARRNLGEVPRRDATAPPPQPVRHADARAGVPGVRRRAGLGPTLPPAAPCARPRALGLARGARPGPGLAAPEPRGARPMPARAGPLRPGARRRPRLRALRRGLGRGPPHPRPAHRRLGRSPVPPADGGAAPGGGRLERGHLRPAGPRPLAGHRRTGRLGALHRPLRRADPRFPRRLGLRGEAGPARRVHVGRDRAGDGAPRAGALRRHRRLRGRGPHRRPPHALRRPPARQRRGVHARMGGGADGAAVAGGVRRRGVVALQPGRRGHLPGRHRLLLRRLGRARPRPPHRHVALPALDAHRRVRFLLHGGAFGGDGRAHPRRALPADGRDGALPLRGEPRPFPRLPPAGIEFAEGV